MAQPFDPRKRGIPTMYGGRRYRSRLEARWAAFFDLAGWPFEYEPFDLDGWIPDFALQGLIGFLDGYQLRPGPILVEVKPTMNVQEFPWPKIAKACPPDLEVLALGYNLAKAGSSTEWHGYAQLGWLGGWPAIFNYTDKRLDFFHSLMSFQDRIHGHYDGDSKDCPSYAAVRGLWQEAGNLVQWRKPKDR